MSEKRYECMIYDCHFPTQTARFRMPSDFLVAGGIYEIRRLRSSTDDDRAVWAGLPDPPEYEEDRPDAD
ncbi:hypothetical protein GGR43_003380 [Sphingobium jiangsuense]|uniref:Uncharacterized protein n=2 Tax=Sphingobium jiangsuense TaxID=870476 RepID=A0A7W6BIQ8_9SPHN|nr:hypothetical protein [Sphingobium jiangsuense]MBB3927648.1 hypothetical protein [Sphingobium jiangsuense]